MKYLIFLVFSFSVIASQPYCHSPEMQGYLRFSLKGIPVHKHIDKIAQQVLPKVEQQVASLKLHDLALMGSGVDCQSEILTNGKALEEESKCLFIPKAILPNFALPSATEEATYFDPEITEEELAQVKESKLSLFESTPSVMLLDEFKINEFKLTQKETSCDKEGKQLACQVHFQITALKADIYTSLKSAINNKTLFANATPFQIALQEFEGGAPEITVTIIIPEELHQEDMLTLDPQRSQIILSEQMLKLTLDQLEKDISVRAQESSVDGIETKEDLEKVLKRSQSITSKILPVLKRFVNPSFVIDQVKNQEKKIFSTINDSIKNFLPENKSFPVSIPVSTIEDSIHAKQYQDFVFYIKDRLQVVLNEGDELSSFLEDRLKRRKFRSGIYPFLIKTQKTLNDIKAISDQVMWSRNPELLKALETEPKLSTLISDIEKRIWSFQGNIKKSQNMMEALSLNSKLLKKNGNFDKVLEMTDALESSIVENLNGHERSFDLNIRNITLDNDKQLHADLLTCKLSPEQQSIHKKEDIEFIPNSNNNDEMFSASISTPWMNSYLRTLFEKNYLSLCKKIDLLSSLSGSSKSEEGEDAESAILGACTTQDLSNKVKIKFNEPPNFINDKGELKFVINNIEVGLYLIGVDFLGPHVSQRLSFALNLSEVDGADDMFNEKHITIKVLNEDFHVMDLVKIDKLFKNFMSVFSGAYFAEILIEQVVKRAIITPMINQTLKYAAPFVSKSINSGLGAVPVAEITEIKGNEKFITIFGKYEANEIGEMLNNSKAE